MIETDGNGRTTGREIISQVVERLYYEWYDITLLDKDPHGQGNLLLKEFLMPARNRMEIGSTEVMN